MHLDCPCCGRTLEYTDKRPSFCAYCGKPLVIALESTGDFQPEETTLPPVAPAVAVPGPPPPCIGGCRLVRPLGSGGMGTVYEAEEVATGRRVALKLISPEFAGSQETVARFRQEGRLASQVVHPRCVFVHKADEDAGRPYIVMELMPGTTLQDLVQAKGPLAPEDAVRKILDVLEGLQEAHRLGIIHRDIKPSNCFLDSDGRVKIGDFGLSRSLMSDARLTRAGSFLGTPLYAAPEQIRADPVDQQSDVYSVAATLYYLLAGHAPHQTGDAAATMARIVCEDAPPLRDTRADLPAALDRAVLRGLERDRGRRWANLEEFKHALLPFAAERLAPAGRSIRLAAFVVDAVLLAIVSYVVNLAYGWFTHGHPLSIHAKDFSSPLWLSFLDGCLLVGYFTVLEGLWGASVGKQLFGLRVCTAASPDPPAVPRAMVRSLAFALFLAGFLLEGPLLTLLTEANGESSSDYPWIVWVIFGLSWLAACLPPVSMRTSNGLRALHDLVSSTRVVALHSRAAELHVPARDLEREVCRDKSLPERLGPFAVLGLVASARAERVLLGRDSILDRQVFLWLRPAAAAALAPQRHQVTRGSRLRWLACGQEHAERWDAFVAPAGCLLADLVARQGRFPWAIARPLLDQLAEELVCSQADATLPEFLTTEQVWLQTDGRVCLLEFSLQGQAQPPAALDAAAPALPLLRETALLLLEGCPRGEHDRAPDIKAPLPPAAAAATSRLLRGTTLEAFHADLEKLRDRPACVTATTRLVHLQMMGLFLAIGLAFMFLSPSFVYFERIDYSHFLASRAEALTRRMEARTAAAAAAAVSPDPHVVVSALDRLMALQDRAKLLERVAKDQQQKQNSLLQLLSSPMRRIVLSNLRSISGEDYAARIKDRSGLEEDLEQELSRSLAQIEELEELLFLWQAQYGSTFNVQWLLAYYLVFPGVWVLWATLFRGGVSYRLSGLMLVRSDGRAAARWQCGLRALLVWTPVVGLLGLSVVLEAWFLAEGNDPTSAWIAWLSWATWWLALLLLPLYVFLALRRPERALHDRLAGTFLVPC